MPILAPTETLDRFETIELLQAYYQHPPHYGSLADATLSLSGHTPGCSDQLTLYIRLRSDGQRIEQVQFEGVGCTISQAAAALLCERVTGLPVTELATLDIFTLLPELDRGVLVSRIRCATLALGLLKVGVASAAAQVGEQKAAVAEPTTASLKGGGDEGNRTPVQKIPP